MPDADAVAALAERVVPALGPGRVWIDVTTSRPALIREIAAAVQDRGAAFADAPVTGGPPQAASGELASLVGCAEEDFPAVEVVVGAYSKLVLRFGEVGAGPTAKLLNNLVSQGTMALLAEAFGLARAHGVAWRPLYEAMSAGAARSGTLEKSVGPALEGDYDGARFTIANAAKDLRYAVELADTPSGCPLARGLRMRLCERGPVPAMRTLSSAASLTRRSHIPDARVEGDVGSRPSRDQRVWRRRVCVYFVDTLWVPA